MMYFLALVLLTSGALADSCGILNATFTVSPQICHPQYQVASQYANNNTGGDILSSFLSSLSPLPSRSCVVAYTDYYCAEFFPECSGNITRATCKSACDDVVSACANDTLKFNNSNLPLPSRARCDSLNTTSLCTTTPKTDISGYYTDCRNYNMTNFTTMEAQILCRPTYKIPIGNLSYPAAEEVFFTFKAISEQLTNLPMYSCAKFFAAFYCTKAFPPCPKDGALPIQPICASVCENVTTACENFVQYFNTSSHYQIPSLVECASLPTTNCFTPTQNDTYIGLFFDDPPIPYKPTTTTTTTGSYEYNNGIKYPPGGAATGGAIGAAMLLVLLGIISLLMLVMRKQER